jgi:hypothetical protein
MAEDDEEFPRGVALFPECVECGACWLPGDERRWQLHFADIDDSAGSARIAQSLEFGDDA